MFLNDVSWNLIANNHLHHSEILLVELTHKVAFVSSHCGIRGKEANHERVRMNEAHGPVSQAQISLGHGGDLACSHFKYFQRGFTSSAEPGATSQKHSALKVHCGHAGKRSNLSLKKLGCNFAQSA